MATANHKQEKATKQAKVSPISGTPPPVANQFGQPNGNPRHNGVWKKDDTPRYKLEQMMKLPETELIKVIDDIDAPLFERKLAKAINSGEWREIESMVNQVYGQPKSSTDITSNGKEISMPVVRIIDERQKD